ncbi:MAG: hypothetical protein IPJ18_01375 [Betaproteobacteria bacterium]|nr:hypothetical protein [Betaproteobacteria bacterium]
MGGDLSWALMLRNPLVAAIITGARPTGAAPNLDIGPPKPKRLCLRLAVGWATARRR